MRYAKSLFVTALFVASQLGGAGGNVPKEPQPTPPHEERQVQEQATVTESVSTAASARTAPAMHASALSVDLIAAALQSAGHQLGEPFGTSATLHSVQTLNALTPNEVLPFTLTP